MHTFKVHISYEENIAAADKIRSTFIYVIYDAVRLLRQ